MDVNDANFESAVIERSRSVPVVVDFWAAWCAPCRMLRPILEREVACRDGAVELAKLDVDSNPQTAQAYGIQGIPAVKAFRDGRVVNEFVGAIPAMAVRIYPAPRGCDEICDVCTSRVGPVSGVNNVQAYWSVDEDACIIPTVWSVRHTLAWARTRLNGKGLRSVADPILSLNQFIVNW